MGVTITQAASTLSVSEKTVRRRIKNGTLPAELVGDPPRYEIDPEALDSVQDESTQRVDNGHDNVYPLVQILQEQLQEKDRQIKELHILLQGAQEQTSRMLVSGNGHRKHWWWPFA